MTIDGVARQHYEWAVSQGSDAVNRKVKPEGGHYRLCWCSGWPDDGACEAANDFGVDGGTMTLQGPLFGQTRTCIGCRVRTDAHDIAGVDFSDRDRIMILPICGFPNEYHDFIKEVI